MAMRRWRNRLAGIPARILMRTLSRRVPHQEYDSIRLIVADSWLEPDAQRFFDRTKESLASAASLAPHAYKALRHDIKQVVLTRRTDTSPYQRFQFAAVVQPQIALEANTEEYAVWLLHTSSYLHGEEEARSRCQEFLDSLEPEHRARAAAWLAETTHSTYSVGVDAEQ